MLRKSIKIVVLGVIACWPRWATAAYPPTQDYGSVQYSTSVAITVSTIPAILLSTGSNVYSDGSGPGPVSLITSSGSNTETRGQFMQNRIQITVFNYSSHPVWIGYDNTVTTFPSVSMGFKIDISSNPGNGVWTSNDSIRNYFITSEDFIPQRQIVIKQSR